MSKSMWRATTLLGGALLLVAPGGGSSPPVVGEFGSYWYQGKAEISRYELSQSRYGEIHPGQAVLVFVTEDFLPEKQVKADSTDRASTGAIPVLKLNHTRSFLTGIYPYSVMTSVFTPIESARQPRSLKTTTSMQEWCGHVFTQANLRGTRYRFQTYSYFEREGDQTFDLEAVWLEDEMWTRVRIDPRSLPTGEIRIIPSGIAQRFSHRPFAVERATATLEDAGEGQRVYRVVYRDTGRELAIRFGSTFPHRIEGWEEIASSSEKSAGLVTRARRTHTLLDDYWSHNSTGDVERRRKLGL
jgi:hypothetical protein